MISRYCVSASLFAVAAFLSACSNPQTPGNDFTATTANNSADNNAVYATYGVHNAPDVSKCTRPDCSYTGEKGRPADPIYPAFWQSRWTMYRVFANYAGALPPYAGAPKGLVPGRDYEVSYGATYYDSTWKSAGKGPDGEGAMMEHYEKRCLPIFPFTNNTFTCSFISLGNTAFFLTYPQDRPKGMPPVCLFSNFNHPPRRDFITHLPYSAADSAQLGAGAQAYSFWVGDDGKPFQTGVKPDQTERGGGLGNGVMFGYAFARVNGTLQPQSFYFSGFPLTPPDAPFVSQNYSGFAATKPDPAKTWDLVSKLDPAKLPACTVMNGPSSPTLKAGQKRPLTWFDIGKRSR